MEAIQESISVEAITQNREFVYSVVCPSASATGINPDAVIRVPASIGAAHALYAPSAASILPAPCSSFTCIISITIMASSTRRPRDTIIDPSDTMWRSIPLIFINRKDEHTTTGTHIARTIPLLRPRENRLAAITIISASTSASVNSPIELFTTFG